MCMLLRDLQSRSVKRDRASGYYRRRRHPPVAELISRLTRRDTRYDVLPVHLPARRARSATRSDRPVERRPFGSGCSFEAARARLSVGRPPGSQLALNPP